MTRILPFTFVIFATYTMILAKRKVYITAINVAFVESVVKKTSTTATAVAVV